MRKKEKDKWFKIFFIAGTIIGIMLEVINSSKENSVGIGIIVYNLIMILYYQIFRK